MQQAKPIVIRKYPNRRLYDTSSRRYVNLDDVAALVRQGTNFQVVDAKTGDDLTRVVLTQIIVEDARGPAGRIAPGAASTINRGIRSHGTRVRHVVSQIGF